MLEHSSIIIQRVLEKIMNAYKNIDNPAGVAETDKYLGTRELQGEGRWFIAYQFEDADGVEYEIWQDQDGDEKIIESNTWSKTQARLQGKQF